MISLWGPDIELVRFKNIDFFPGPIDLKKVHTLCIGTKSRNLGDALALTSLPEKLKTAYPDLQVTTYPRGFNRAVFYGNPHVDAVSYLPSEVYGDDNNWGEGQLIQLKERFFGLPISNPPAPKIFLTPKEEEWIAKLLEISLFPRNCSKPLCVIHPWGSTRNCVAPPSFWDGVVERWSHEFRFWQVGVEGHSIINGCEYYLLLPKIFRSCRKLFAALSRASAFIGVDSGPMHVARAFGVRSLILFDHGPAEGDVKTIFRNRAESPYFLKNNFRYSPLYAENEHVLTNAAMDKRVDQFLEKT